MSSIAEIVKVSTYSPKIAFSWAQMDMKWHIDAILRALLSDFPDDQSRKYALNMAKDTMTWLKELEVAMKFNPNDTTS